MSRHATKSESQRLFGKRDISTSAIAWMLITLRVQRSCPAHNAATLYAAAKFNGSEIHCKEEEDPHYAESPVQLLAQVVGLCELG
jgi:hypothetical protein